MKKAKIMLTAIAVFAIVGGALAFKAKSVFNATIYTSPNSTTPATFTVLNKTITSEEQPTRTYATLVYSALPVYTYTIVKQ